WNDPGITALTATFLDPRFKDLNFLTHVKRKEVHKYIHNLILKYLENNNQCNLNDIEENSGSLKSALSLFFEDVSAKGKQYIFFNIKQSISLLTKFYYNIR
ncbi:6419_t:CDS:1, partial [Entrophospora sp. SA101]